MKTIPMAHFETKYSLQENGIIISHRENKPIKPSLNPNGYWKYTFCLNGKREQLLIHQVMAKHFLPNPYNYIQVNHKDGIKANNEVSNLEWISGEDNIEHALRIGLKSGYMSYNNKCSFLQEVLDGALIRTIAIRIGRREEVLSKMLRETAKKENREHEWKQAMQKRRKATALRNLAKINN